MLEFKKKILVKVSFDLSLFEKELNKAINWLIPDELEELKNWCYRRFSGDHVYVLNKCFDKSSVKNF